MKKILFYPGTFNPPHLGHASVVEVALKNINFDEVWIMPSGKRLDKVITNSYEDRRKLGEIFVEYLQSLTDTPIKLLTNEIDNIEGKYTHEIIVELKSQSKDEIYQLVGIDGYLNIKEGLIAPNEKFIIIKRSGYDIPENLASSSNLVILDEGLTGISSTKIREMIKSGNMGYQKFVPEKIAEYIHQKGLYL